MPSAPKELQDRWQHNEFMDQLAWNQLAERFFNWRGVIHPMPGVVPTEDDYSAIDYLIQEWDYGYNDDPAPDIVKSNINAREPRAFDSDCDLDLV